MVGLQGGGEDHDHRKIAKRLKERDEQAGADGLARHQPSRGDGTARGARPADRHRHAADRGRPGRGRRSRKRAKHAGLLGGYDVYMLDTAGRLHIDEVLMEEVEAVRDIAARVRRFWWSTG
jgi:signal recognition particle subunit SRP54